MEDEQERLFSTKYRTTTAYTAVDVKWLLDCTVMVPDLGRFVSGYCDTRCALLLFVDPDRGLFIHFREPGKHLLS